LPLVVLLCAVAWAEEGPPPTDAVKLEGSARLAKAEYDAAVKRAKAVYDQAVAATNRVYQEKLRAAVKEAMQAGNLEQANAINAELRALVSRTPDRGKTNAVSDASAVPLASAGPVEFVGRWVSREGPLNVFPDKTTRENNGTVVGSWKIEDGKLVVTWKTGWRSIVSKAKDGYLVTAYRPGSEVADHTDPIRRLPVRSP
jgi:hypothetical protein